MSVIVLHFERLTAVSHDEYIAYSAYSTMQYNDG